jgi:hypothetical protein
MDYIERLCKLPRTYFYFQITSDDSFTLDCCLCHKLVESPFQSCSVCLRFVSMDCFNIDVGICGDCRGYESADSAEHPELTICVNKGCNSQLEFNKLTEHMSKCALSKILSFCSGCGKQYVRNKVRDYIHIHLSEDFKFNINFCFLCLIQVKIPELKFKTHNCQICGLFFSANQILLHPSFYCPKLGYLNYEKVNRKFYYYCEALNDQLVQKITNYLKADIILPYKVKCFVCGEQYGLEHFLNHYSRCFVDYDEISSDDESEGGDFGGDLFWCRNVHVDILSDFDFMSQCFGDVTESAQSYTKSIVVANNISIFKKTIKLKNNGNVNWPNPAYLVCQDYQVIKGRATPIRVEIKPGKYAFVEITLDLKEVVSLGNYPTYWHLEDENSEQFGKFTIIVIVKYAEELKQFMEDNNESLNNNLSEDELIVANKLKDVLPRVSDEEIKTAITRVGLNYESCFTFLSDVLDL